MKYEFELRAESLIEIFADLLFVFALIRGELGHGELAFALHEFEGTLRSGSGFYPTLTRELGHGPIRFSEAQFARFALDVNQTIDAVMDVRSQHASNIDLVIRVEDSSCWTFSTDNKALYARLEPILQRLARGDLARVHWMDPTPTS